jgi:CheY-like chemotaxis protein
MIPTSNFDLPAAGTVPGPAQNASAAARDCIVIADDSELYLAIMRKILSPHFDILEARTGTEIVQILRSPPRPISAILLDMVMPIMDGFQILDFMQKNGLLGVIPVIAITALSDSQSRIQCYEAGASDVLDKPVDSTFLPFKVRWDIDHFRHLHALSEHPVAHAQVEQMEALLSALPAAIFVEDANTGVLLHCNDNFLRFRGVPENPVGQPIDAFPIAPEMLAAIRTAREAILVDRISKPVLYKGAQTGSAYSVLYRTFLNPVSNVTQLLGFITNVTNEIQEITALEDRIRELEGRYPS